ncbi:MAG: hypothetical protein ACYDEY_05600 [Acidimicrobiales bacterium]
MVAEIAKLREAVEAGTAKLSELTARLAERDARVAELLRLLQESRRSGKRQAAPFSKLEPIVDRCRAGRDIGQARAFVLMTGLAPSPTGSPCAQALGWSHPRESVKVPRRNYLQALRLAQEPPPAGAEGSIAERALIA